MSNGSSPRIVTHMTVGDWIVSDIVARLQRDLEGDLNRVAARFVEGAKLTLIVRNPNTADGNVVLSNETDVDAAVEELRKWQAEGGHRG